MSRKTAKAEVALIRQETQYTCMAASLASCMRALNKPVTEADVNKVMGASPMRGASWEDLTAAAQYFGLRTTLVTPSTIEQLRSWTDAGTPVVIAYNPEGRPWSHASVVFDVTGEGEDTRVYIMDPNIPDPEETVRIYDKKSFYKIWSEPLGDKMVIRRPACAVEREVTSEGRQVMARLEVSDEFYAVVAKFVDRLTAVYPHGASIGSSKVSHFQAVKSFLRNNPGAKLRLASEDARALTATTLCAMFTEEGDRSGWPLVLTAGDEQLYELWDRVRDNAKTFLLSARR